MVRLQLAYSRVMAQLGVPWTSKQAVPFGVLGIFEVCEQGFRLWPGESIDGFLGE